MAEIVTMPKLGFDMAEGTLVRWVIAEGEEVKKGAVLAEIETDKATVEVEANASGTLLRHLVEQGSIVPVNTPIAIIGQPGEELPLLGESKQPAQAESRAELEKEPSAAVKAAQSVTEGEDGNLPAGVRATPLARRLALESGIDIRNVRGSGPLGRIRKEDVEAYLEQQAQKPAETLTTPTPAITPQVLPLPTFPPAEEKRIPLTKLRAIIGKRMVQSTQSAPHFFVTHEVDVEALLNLRQAVNQLLPDGDKISVNDFVIRATALALRAYPNLNASIDEEKGEIIQHAAINIGVAVALESGLITVVCKNADQKSVRMISQEVRALVARAREGKVRTEDIEGSTFSISNLGMFDVAQFSAIINPPEAAILAVGSARQLPVVKENSLQIGWRMNLTISVDHRISDGAEAAQFLQHLARYLENPLHLLI
ncbi:MAG: dihydrolipoamide acyltransferase [Anaerolineae bacterium]|jgi:pyruvate dehydrogenase E2 component (dihydrolipoamide acetyltransferase)|nr:MAG: dihydrolipoamide acyltransferase [Anaerolineae bacterium]